MAEWNPEKDLLAIVTDDSKVLLHRFNWQRLWTVFPGSSLIRKTLFKLWLGNIETDSKFQV